VAVGVGFMPVVVGEGREGESESDKWCGM